MVRFPENEKGDLLIFLVCMVKNITISHFNQEYEKYENKVRAYREGGKKRLPVDLSEAKIEPTSNTADRDALAAECHHVYFMEYWTRPVKNFSYAASFFCAVNYTGESE